MGNKLPHKNNHQEQLIESNLCFDKTINYQEYENFILY